MKDMVYISGSIVPEDRACVSVFDRGLNYGDGLFETLKAKRGDLMFLKEHLKRLKLGAKALSIPVKPLEELEREIKAGAVERLLKANGLFESTASVRITVTRGADKGAHAPSRGLKPTMIIMTRPVDIKAISSIQKNGVKAVLIKGYSPALPGIKSLNFLPNVLGRIEAKRRGAIEGIFTGGDSSLLEGTSTNIFIVIKGVLMTPLLKKEPWQGVLPGVARDAAIRLAKENGIKVEESAIYEKDLRSCQEAFLTNSVMEIAPLAGVDGRPVGGGRPGPVTRLLQRAFGKV